MSLGTLLRIYWHFIHQIRLSSLDVTVVYIYIDYKTNPFLRLRRIQEKFKMSIIVYTWYFVQNGSKYHGDLHIIMWRRKPFNRIVRGRWLNSDS